MPIQIGEKPSPTFAAPLALLSDCHRRVERFLDLLLLVAAQAGGGPLTGPQREALETALRYFREAAPKHTQDEEISLFPRLRAVGGSQVQRALQQIDGLETDHREAQAGHELVERLGQRWLAEQHLDPEALASLSQTLTQLRATYARHIRLEDEEIFPLAGQVLDQATLHAVGREMAARRGQILSPPPDPS